jgi:hypothetical protein
MEKHKTVQTNDQAGLGLDFKSIGFNDGKSKLSNKETRRIITPYAFFVADELLGTPLASPFRRAFGLLIDLFFITLLTQVSSLVLASVAAFTFFRAGNRLKTKKRFNAARMFLRLLVAFLLFVVAVGIVDEVNDGNSSDDESPDTPVNIDSTVGGIELMALTAKYLLETKDIIQQVAEKNCEPAYDCLKILGEELVQDVVDVGLDRDSIDGVLEGYLGSVSESINAEQQTNLTRHLQSFVESKQSYINSLQQELVEQMSMEQTHINLDGNVSETNKSYYESNRLIRWLENVMDELGLGLGWAAFYFSIFTAWWQGQTPGKKMMGMKVIKLDNTPLNLLESFGRYGGYAAGLATGLMGFVQVFWDPNRQAIQDKISETLVIDIRKLKIPFVKEKVE